VLLATTLLLRSPMLSCFSTQPMVWNAALAQATLVASSMQVLQAWQQQTLLVQRMQQLQQPLLQP
jgi:hypothetical protein